MLPETNSECLSVSLPELLLTAPIILVLRTFTLFLLPVSVVVLTDFLLLVGFSIHYTHCLAAGDMFMASVKKGKPELRKKGIFVFLCVLII